LIFHAKSRRVLFLLAVNLICSTLLYFWCDSSNSIGKIEIYNYVPYLLNNCIIACCAALKAYSYTLWFNFLSLLTSLLSLWVSSRGPSHFYTFGYERFEVLAVFSSTVLAKLGVLFVAKECIERLFEQPKIHT
jgi:solute carrier family 30 (zinc transporter), member 6